MSSLPEPYITPEEYLAIERKAKTKSEYWYGRMYAMSGARLAHVQINENLSAELVNQLRGRDCQALSRDMRVRVQGKVYTYPDAVVVCGKPQLLDGELDTLLNPVLIVEILSPSTEGYDRRDKFAQYKTIESLREYLLIASERVGAELLTRTADGRWAYDGWGASDDVIPLTSCNCQLRLGDLYDRVTFSSDPTPASRQ
jgi:Uma2 family endonuclease